MKSLIVSTYVMVGILCIALGVLGGHYILTHEHGAGGSSLLGDSSFVKSVTPIDAVTASTTSSAIDILEAKRVTLAFTNDAASLEGYATTTFTVQVSTDGTNFATYSQLIEPLANSNSQTVTRVASEVLDTDVTTVFSLDLEYAIYSHLKVIATLDAGATTTTATAKALIEF